MIRNQLTFGEEYRREKNEPSNRDSANDSTLKTKLLINNEFARSISKSELIEQFLGADFIKPTREQARTILEKNIKIEHTHSTLWLMWDVTQKSSREKAIKTMLEILEDFGFIREDVND